MRSVLAIGLMVLLSVPGMASPGLLAVTPETINGIWESVDFGAGKFYRLEVRFPVATLIVACPKLERSDFVFKSVKVSVGGGTIDFTAKEIATGMEMHVRGKGRANDTLGEATLSLRVRDDDNRPLLKEWNEPGREFWKRSSGSRIDDLVKAERRAAELSRQQ
jgi:hypothetical protein